MWYNKLENCLYGGLEMNFRTSSKFSTNDLLEMKRQYEAGEKLYWIAHRLNTTSATVCKWLKKIRSDEDLITRENRLSALEEKKIQAKRQARLEEYKNTPVELSMDTIYGNACLVYNEVFKILKTEGIMALKPREVIEYQREFIKIKELYKAYIKEKDDRKMKSLTKEEVNELLMTAIFEMVGEDKEKLDEVIENLENLKSKRKKNYS